ncbi:MAG: CehA/McbA family metallohydrolase domain-containing protein, partial [Planctomycetota bacterium]
MDGACCSVVAETTIAVDEQRLRLSEFRIYRGETHAHTVYTYSHGNHLDKDKSPKADWDRENYSNYQGPPEKYFEQAKAKGFDFFVVTDHSQEEPFQPVDAQKNKAWLDIQAAAEKYTDETFVAMAGFEFSRNAQFDAERTGTGHMNAINVSEYVNAKQMGIPRFYDWLKQAKAAHGQGCVVASFNHPGITGYQDWAYLDAGIMDIVTMFELRTVYRGDPRWEAYVRALNKGWKVSPISVTDSHGYWHLENIPPLTCVLATELTKEALTRAMRQRRTYTSWAGERKTRVELKYSVNGYVMGSMLE